MEKLKPTLVILAAGMGSRYGGLKQLDAVGPGGETIIDYSVFDAIKAGFGKIVFVIRPHFEADFREQLVTHFETHIQCECVYQELEYRVGNYPVPEDRKKPWGTGHAALVTESVVNTPFSVINADDFYGRNSLETIARFLSEPQLAQTTRFAMVGFTLRKTLSEHGSVSRGICQYDTSWFLDTVVETTRIFKRGNAAYYLDEQEVEYPLTGDEIVSMNFWGFTPRIFQSLQSEFDRFLKERGTEIKSEFFLPSVVNHLIETGEATVKVLPTKDSWFGITYRDDKETVINKIRSLIGKGIYPEKLWDHKQ